MNPSFYRPSHHKMTQLTWKNMARLFVIVSIISISSILSAIDFYVGDPDIAPGTGTMRDPFESIAYALTQLPANDDCSLVFLRGLYDNDDLHYINRQLELRSDTNNPEDVVIAESFQLVSLGQQIHTIKLRGLTFRGDNDNSTQIHESALTVENCIFEDYELGTPLNFDGDVMSVSLANCIFRNNDVGISDMNGNWASRGAIQNCLFHSNRVAVSVNGALLENCTITDNGVANEGRFGANTYRNSILWGNETLNTGLASVYYYCDTQEAVNGANNISLDPRFEDPFNEIYALKWDVNGPSPCIDAGDPNSGNDPDGTRKDIGYRYYPHEVKTYSYEITPHRGIYWKCFPVLDTVSAPHGTAWNELGYMFRDHMLFNPIPQIEIIGWSYAADEGEMSYDSQQGIWSNEDFQATAPKGFKLYFEPHQQPDDLTISGFRANPVTVPVELCVDVNGSYFSNWVGYFVSQTQSLDAALSKLIPDGGGASYLDYIYSIKAQTWSTSREDRSLGSRWIVDPSRFTLSEESMVELQLIDGAPSEMYWYSYGAPVSSYTRATPAQFTYTETMDYTPLYVQLDPENLPDELGVYAGDQCIGAVVVDHEIMDINLYYDNTSADENIQIALHYGAKGKAVMHEYTVYNSSEARFVPSSLRLRDIGDYGYISLKGEADNSELPAAVILNQNYPNPFNPTTQISFHLGKDTSVILEVFNVRGQKVKTLCVADLAAGAHSFTWNGNDQAGKEVSSGLYFYRLHTSEGILSNKMLLMK